MKILIFGANWYNRGDEAAIRAMIDSIKRKYKGVKIKIHFNQKVELIPYDDIDILNDYDRYAGRNFLKRLHYYVTIYSNGKINLLRGYNRKNFNEFLEAVKWADLAVYAPGGPMIGDYYIGREQLLDKMYLFAKNNLPYVFFAPSMGPFHKSVVKIKNRFANAELICFREAISEKYYQKLGLNVASIVTRDSAFQNDIDNCYQQKVLKDDYKLNQFLLTYKKIIGITVTDLNWHRNYKNSLIQPKIKEVFTEFMEYLDKENYAVIFIPQLFVSANDQSYMSEFATYKNSYVLSENYDCYFQQFLISKLFAVVGMRYHSNIFAAKMGVPFVSVSYEQKMDGFMENAGLGEYCIKINDLSFEKLSMNFEKMIQNHDTYKKYLQSKHAIWKNDSAHTLELVDEIIKRHGFY